MFKKIKRQITLIEIMIVMFLIAMIIGVVAYNYQGSLEEGKAFKTKTSIEKIKTILTLAISDNAEYESNLESNWKKIIQDSPLIQNSKEMIKDGWGQEYQVRFLEGRVQVTSRKFEDYKRSHPTSMFKGDKEE